MSPPLPSWPSSSALTLLPTALPPPQSSPPSPSPCSSPCSPCLSFLFASFHLVGWKEAAECLAVLDMRLANSVRGSHLDGRDILSLSTVLYKCCSLIFDLGHVKYERGIPWLDLYQNICTHKANQNKSWLYSRKLKIQLTPRSRPNRKMIRVRPWQT